MPKPLSEEKKLEWRNLIEQQRQSGLSIAKWCSQKSHSAPAFYYWKEKLFLKPLQKTSFTEIHIKKPDSITLQACGISIRIGSDCDPILRKQIFSLFAGGLC
jgi:hypothetical protein